MIFFFVMFALLGGLFAFHFLTRKYCNPYKLIMIFGKKGAGKSTTIAKLAVKHLKQGWIVYSTEPVPGCRLINPREIESRWFPPNSVVFIDEVGMLWDNRGFKTFPQGVRDFFKLQRHGKIKVYLFSQSFDVDKKIRDLVDGMYLLENRLRVFSYGRRINKKFVLTKAETNEDASSIAENLVFDSVFWFWCGSRILTYIPRYAPLFDSHWCPQREDIAFDAVAIPSGKIAKLFPNGQKSQRKRRSFAERVQARSIEPKHALIQGDGMPSPRSRRKRVV